MRLIDADFMEKTLRGLQQGDNECWTPMEFKDYVLDYQPTVEAEPVVHAHWEPYRFEACYCSKCKKFAHRDYDGEAILSDYCPHCGAKMDEVQDD